MSVHTLELVTMIYLKILTLMMKVRSGTAHGSIFMMSIWHPRVLIERRPGESYPL